MFSSFTSRIYCTHVHNEQKPVGEHAFATFHSSHTKTNLKRDRKRREKITLYDSVVCHAQPPYLHSVVTGKNSRAIPAEKTTTKTTPRALSPSPRDEPSRSSRTERCGPRWAAITGKNQAKKAHLNSGASKRSPLRRAHGRHPTILMASRRRRKKNSGREFPGQDGTLEERRRFPL